MSEAGVQHTIEIFSRLFNIVESVLPDTLRKEMGQALKSLRSDLSLSMEEVEDTIIVFGKKVWPYRKAFGEFIAAHEAYHGEEIFVAKLSREARKKYQLFKEQGGSFRDFYTGTNMGYFTTPERLSLCGTFIEMKKEVREYVVQQIKSTQRTVFEARVQEFKDILQCIEGEIEHLSGMAEEEQEHPQLASEIRAQIRGFEFGLSLLGPETRYEAVCQAADHFHGRKKDLRHMR